MEELFLPEEFLVCCVLPLQQFLDRLRMQAETLDMPCEVLLHPHGRDI